MTIASGPYGIPAPGFRLPAGTRPGRVRLQVGDLGRSRDYYQRVIGLRPVSAAAGALQFSAQDSDRVLVELSERTGARPAPRRGALGLYHFAILLPDRPSLGRFVRHALATGSVTGMADHLVSEALYLTDPDGLGIEVYADRPRETWRVDGMRQLAMATDPLDADSLIASAGDEPWTGLPSGTTMGHVHLHVGDLRLAEAFYHRALGFDKTVWTYPGALFMSAGGYHHHLGTNTWSSGRPSAEDQARLLSWDLHVPGAGAAADAAASVKAAGHPVQETGNGAAASDPWGTVVRLVADGSAPADSV